MIEMDSSFPPSLEWVEPPPSTPPRRSSKFYDDLVADLKKRPGQTAIVQRASRQFRPRGHLLPGYSALRRRGVDVSQRIVDGEIVLYARWPQ